jgi:hypothetical protein
MAAPPIALKFSFSILDDRYSGTAAPSLFDEADHMSRVGRMIATIVHVGGMPLFGHPLRCSYERTVCANLVTVRLPW